MIFGSEIYSQQIDLFCEVVRILSFIVFALILILPFAFCLGYGFSFYDTVVPHCWGQQAQETIQCVPPAYALCCFIIRDQAPRTNRLKYGAQQQHIYMYIYMYVYNMGNNDVWEQVSPLRFGRRLFHHSSVSQASSD